MCLERYSILCTYSVLYLWQQIALRLSTSLQIKINSFFYTLSTIERRMFLVC